MGGPEDGNRGPLRPLNVRASLPALIFTMLFQTHLAGPSSVATELISFSNFPAGYRKWADLRRICRKLTVINYDMGNMEAVG